MDALFTLLLIWGIGYYVYRSGKREGSRKGFHAGRSRGRRHRR